MFGGTVNDKEMIEDYRLKIFASVCETGSFTKTAVLFGISQPAVSQNVSELERHAGVRLFERTKGEVRLTSEGLMMYHHVVKILNGYEVVNTLFGNLDVNRSLSSGPLRLFISPMLKEILLSDSGQNIMRLAGNLYPQMQLSLTDEIGEAQVKIEALVKNTDTGIKLDVSVLANNYFLAEFFKKLADYCLRS